MQDDSTVGYDATLTRPATAYRRDIDGLRAIAIIPVILFHAHFLCPGGFVGVDIFFVISGYLITALIERDAREGRFSLRVFYQRRIRRIFPALFTVFAVSTLVAGYFVPSVDLKDFGKSLLASSAFSSNILFYREAGYFAAAAEFKPLLHTWTLSVEEQFYVFWPLILAALSLSAVSRLKITIVMTILVGSLLVSAYWVTRYPAAAFYLLPSRAWELMLGAAMGLPAVSRGLLRLPRGLASAASLSGLLMIGAAVITFDEVTPFPGFAALLPCVGAALIIAAGEGGPSIGGTILSSRLLVWTGLISYSLYLWHWPIFVFARLILNHELVPVERADLILATFIVSWLSWRFVETPFRGLRVARDRSRTVVMAGLAMSTAFLAIGAVLFMGEGFPTRRPDVARWIQQVQAEQQSLQVSPCLARGPALPPADGCLLGAPSRTSRYQAMLWGDSHATDLAPAIDDVGKRLGMTIREVTKAGCPPVPGVRFFPVFEMRVECPAFNDAVLRTVLADRDVPVVILAARWDAMLMAPVRSYAGSSALLTLDGTRPSVSDSRQLLSVSLRKTLTALVDSGRRVIVVGQVPLAPADIIGCITRALFNRRDVSACATLQETDVASTEDLVNQVLQEAAANLEPGVQLVYPYQYLCGGHHGCVLSADGRILYMDDSHLSASGSRLLGSGLELSMSSAITATKKGKGRTVGRADVR